MSDENKTAVSLAAAQKPEDFKEAVTGMLNDRLRGAISEAREGVEGSMSGGMGHIQQDEKKSGGKVASDPKASNPGAKGHEQTDEKKKGSKTASDPKASGGGKKEVPDSMGK